MKKILLLTLMLVFAFASTTLYAADKYALGNSNIALKVDYINFTESLDNIDLDLENAIYVGLEGYYSIYPNLYLGMEAGWAGSKNDDQVEGIDVDIDLQFIPIELNLKYVFELDPNWNIGVGAGVSYSFLDIELSGIDRDADDWIFGGQVFADINYKMSAQWFLGIEGKYQFTEDLEFDNVELLDGGDVETNISANNWRVGAKIGYMF